MIQYLKQLAVLRKETAEQKDLEKKCKTAMDESAEGKAYADANRIRKAKETALDALEKDIKAMAINILKDNPLAELAAGLIKKTKTIYKYTIEEAKEWAKTNATYLFKFDETAFKEVATGKNAPDFVTNFKEPDVQIASDLSAYLVEEPAENPIQDLESEIPTEFQLPAEEIHGNEKNLD